MSRPDEHQPWHQLPGEGAKAYSAFLAYLRTGASEGERSIIQAYRDTTGRHEAKSHNSKWSDWASRYNWHERSREYDKHILDRRIQFSLAGLRRLEHERFRVLSEYVQLSRRLKEKAAEMLAFPVREEVVEQYEDGRVKTIIMPARWNYGSLAQLLKLSAEIDESVFANLTSQFAAVSPDERMALIHQRSEDAGFDPDDPEADPDDPGEVPDTIVLDMFRKPEDPPADDGNPPDAVQINRP